MNRQNAWTFESRLGRQLLHYDAIIILEKKWTKPVINIPQNALYYHNLSINNYNFYSIQKKDRESRIRNGNHKTKI